MNITRRVSSLHNPYLPDLVEKLISGEINPIADQVIVFMSGQDGIKELKASLPPDIFSELQLKSAHRDIVDVTFVQQRSNAVYAIACRSLPSEVVQMVTRIRQVQASPAKRFQDVSVYLGPTSTLAPSVDGWPTDQFSGPHDASQLLRAYFESAPTRPAHSTLEFPLPSRKVEPK